MKKQIFKKIIVYLAIISQILILIPSRIWAQDEQIEGDAPVAKPATPESYDRFNEQDGPTDLFISDINGPATPPSTITDSPSTVGQQFNSEKIILNSVDKRKVEQTLKLNQVLPDFDMNESVPELSRLSGKSVDDLYNLKNNNYDQYKKVSDDVNKNIQNDAYVKNRLMNDPVALANLLGATPEEMANEMRDDKNSVSATIDQIMAEKVDIRVIKMLNYLVTPKNLGGAGHWRIKVERITKNYDKESSKYEREDKAIRQENANKENSALQNQTVEQVRAEQSTSVSSIENQMGEESTAVADIVDQKGNRVSTAYIGNQPEEDAQTISAHFTGQAVDISEIDDIKCTTVGRKRIGSDEKTAQAPMPVRLLWQTKEGYAQDQDKINSSFNQMFLANSQQSVLSMLSELNFDFENVGDLQGAKFSDMMALLGQAFLANAISSPGDIWKFNLSETLRQLGAVVLADNLSLDRGPFLDPDVDSIDALSEAIGRNYIETKLNLAYGALKGNNSAELLESVGKARILAELQLPSDILDSPPKDDTDLYQKIGSRIVESTYGFSKGSFYGKGNLGDLKGSVGKYKFDTVMSLASAVDDELDLTAGTTQKLKLGSISPSDYNRLVAEAHFTTFVTIYGNTRHVNGADNSPTIDLPSGKVANLRDETFNLPKGTIDRFLSGTISADDYKNAGIYALAQALETNDTGRDRVSTWLRSPNTSLTVTAAVTSVDNPQITETKEVALPGSEYAGTMGVEIADLYQIFGASNSRGTFKRLGKNLLTEAVKNSDLVQSSLSDLERGSPEIVDAVETFDFYKTRIDNIIKHSDLLRRNYNNLDSALRGIDTSLVSEPVRQELSQSLLKLIASSSESNKDQSKAAFLTAGGFVTDDASSANQALTDISQIVASSANSKIQDLAYKVNATKFETEEIAKSAYEIATGKEQPDFRFEDLKVKDLDQGALTFGGVNFDTSDLALFLSGRVGVKEFLLSLASSKLGSELGMPAWAMKYAAAALDSILTDGADLKDAFFRAIGVATMESQSESPSGSLIATKELERALNIHDIISLVAKKQSITSARAEAIVAESLNLTGFNLDSLMRGDFAAWSLARAKAEEFDHKNALPTGTTEKFVKGGTLGSYDKSNLSSDDIRRIATELNISESSIKTFIAVKNGQQDPDINKIYFVDKNSYSQTSSTANACGQKTIPDGSYVYYDQDGLHTFNSYALANEYRKANPGKELNYLDDIAKGLSGLISVLDSSQTSGIDQYRGTSGAGNLNKELSDFVSNQSQGSANEKSVPILDEVISTNYDVPAGSINNLLTRGNGGATVDAGTALDFLKVLGYNVIKNSAASYISSYLGFNLGSTKITPDDVYDILNGNGKETIARIGGKLLDEELGLNRGTIESILMAGNSDQRKCALEQAAFDMIGDALGARGVELVGSLMNVLGGGQIESYLGLPKGSFRGENINELLDNVPVEDLARSLHLPYSKSIDDEANILLAKIGSDFLAVNKNRDFYDKLSAIRSYVQGLGSDGPQINAELNDLYLQFRANLSAMATSIFSDSTLYGNDANVAITNLWQKPGFPGYDKSEVQILWLAFKNKVDSTDSALGLPAGTTASMLSGIITPNNYRDKSNNNAINNLAGNLILTAVLGNQTSINQDRVNQFVAAIQNIGNGDILSPGNAGNRVAIYQFLNDLFSFNLDDKAGFTEGTLAKIIENPANALPALIREAAIKIDGQLDRLDKNGNPKPASLTNILEIFTSISDQDKALCDNPGVQSFVSCINEHRLSAVTDLAKTELADRAASQISDWLKDVTGVQIDVTASGKFNLPTSVSAFGIQMPMTDIFKVFKGDYRALSLIAMVKGLPGVIGDDSGNLVVAPGFILSYQDFYYAIFGNPAMDDYAAIRAANRQYAITNGSIKTDTPDFTDPTNQSNVYAPSYATGNPMNFAIGANLDDQTKKDIDKAYPIPDGANLTPISPPGLAEPTEPTWNFADPLGSQLAYVSYLDQDRQWHSQMSQFLDQQNQVDVARNRALDFSRGSFRENVTYRTLDCMLYKLDSRIPAGFAYAMYKGNGYLKTSLLINYIENWMLTDSSFGGIFPPGTLNAVYNYFSGPAGVKGNIDLFVQQTEGGILDKVDQFLISNSPSILGITFQPGTAQALFAFVQTNDWAADYKTSTVLGNLDFKSLKNLYGENWMANKISGWVDKTFGFPPGSSYNIYRQWKSMEGAQKALDFWSQDVSTLQSSSKYQELVKSDALKGKSVDEVKSIKTSNSKLQMRQAKAELYSLIINTIFSKQIAQVEAAIGLVPGTGGMMVSMLVQLAMGVPVDPITIGLFIVINLFGVYKTDVICTADGYYPKMEPVPDTAKWDVANLGNFNGLKPRIREANLIRAAQYKANVLISDLLSMSARSGDDALIPVQIMTGRIEDVANYPEQVRETICNKVGTSTLNENTAVCSGWRSRSGLWANPQTTSWTHIGF